MLDDRSRRTLLAPSLLLAALAAGCGSAGSTPSAATAPAPAPTATPTPVPGPAPVLGPGVKLYTKDGGFMGQVTEISGDNVTIVLRYGGLAHITRAQALEMLKFVRPDEP